MPDKKGNAADWKQTLFEYVNAVNEAGLRGEPGKLEQVADAEHRARLSAKIRRSALREADEGIRSIRSEMRARIENSDSARRGAVADVAFHSVRSFEQRGQPWLEERVDRERLRFVLGAAGKWTIASALPLATERRSASYSIEEETYDEAGERGERTGLPSAPYMNPAALYRYGSRVYSGVWSGAAAGWDGEARRGIPYRREAAVAFAERWWNEPSPSYEQFEVNCTNYVSQCLFAGGAPMNYTGKRDSGWWYKGKASGQEQWSYSWAVSNSLAQMLTVPRMNGLRAEVVSSPSELRLGDVICYDWDGSGRFRHSTIVTAFTPEGQPLVNANTVSSRHRYWDYKDSYAWTDRTEYRFFHLADEF